MVEELLQLGCSGFCHCMYEYSLKECARSKQFKPSLVPIHRKSHNETSSQF